MASDSALTIDLSSYSFAGEPASDELTDAELEQLMDVLDEIEAEDEDYGEDFSDAAEQFDQAFNQHYQAEQYRQEAIAAAAVEDVMFPVKRQEDKIARAMHRAADGVYGGQQAEFAADQAGVDIMLANGGYGPCSSVDEYGRCSARYHAAECSHGVSVDWVASGPPASTGQAALANFAAGIELAAPGATWGDPDDPDDVPVPVPQRTVELAHSLADSWGLHGDVPGFPEGLADLTGPASPVSVYDALAQPIGYGGPPLETPSYPGISQLARDLGLK